MTRASPTETCRRVRPPRSRMKYLQRVSAPDARVGQGRPVLPVSGLNLGVEHAQSHVRLVLSDPKGPDVDLLLPPRAGDELGRALDLGGSAVAVAGATVDGDPVTLSAAPGEVSVRAGDDLFRFELGATGKSLRERLLSRPVMYECALLSSPRLRRARRPSALAGCAGGSRGGSGRCRAPGSAR